MKRQIVVWSLSLVMLCLLAACSSATAAPVTVDGLEQAESSIAAADPTETAAAQDSADE
jgi:hypothetical protein